MPAPYRTASRSRPLLVRTLGAAVIATVGMSGCTSTTPSTDHGRHVALDGQSNFRDLGGYQTADGRTVKWGALYRSGELPRLSDDDVAQLEELGVKTVVNFMTPQEVEYRGPDRLPAGVAEISQPIDTSDGIAIELIEARKTGDFSEVPVELNPELHRMLVDVATEEYAALYRVILAEENHPVVFHCSHGIHRTGTASAVLLWSLGVPWETVREDYLLSNTYRKAETERRLGELQRLAAANQGVDIEDVDTTNMRAFYILEGSYIDGTRDRILERYGSVDAYLTDGVGLSTEEIRALRDLLLE